MSSDEGRGPGRPPHIPTQEQRELVAKLVGDGKSVADIADILELSQPTVRKAYNHELTTGRPQLIFPFASAPLGTSPRPKPKVEGRPPHRPTKASRDRVERLVAGGMYARHIAAALGITEPTLREHYEDELENGRARKTAEVLDAQFKAAVAGNVSAQKAFLEAHRRTQALPGSDAAPRENTRPLGKKEERKAAVQTPDVNTPMGELMARRMNGVTIN